MHVATQSEPQLRARWGADGAAAIKNNAATVLLFGGTRDAEDLDGFATLLGDRPERVATVDQHGRVVSATTHRVPVLAPAQLAQLGKGEVVIIHRGMPPALGTVSMVWARRDVRAERRRRALRRRPHPPRPRHPRRLGTDPPRRPSGRPAGPHRQPRRRRPDRPGERHSPSEGRAVPMPTPWRRELRGFQRAPDGDYYQRVGATAHAGHHPDNPTDPDNPAGPAGPQGWR